MYRTERIHSLVGRCVIDDDARQIAHPLRLQNVHMYEVAQGKGIYQVGAAKAFFPAALHFEVPAPNGAPSLQQCIAEYSQLGITQVAESAHKTGH